MKEIMKYNSEMCIVITICQEIPIQLVYCYLDMVYDTVMYYTLHKILYLLIFTSNLNGLEI